MGGEGGGICGVGVNGVDKEMVEDEDVGVGVEVGIEDGYGCGGDEIDCKRSGIWGKLEKVDVVWENGCSERENRGNEEEVWEGGRWNEEGRGSDGSVE